jgi:hypothetical protein
MVLKRKTAPPTQGLFYQKLAIYLRNPTGFGPGDLQAES